MTVHLGTTHSIDGVSNRGEGHYATRILKETSPPHHTLKLMYARYSPPASPRPRHVPRTPADWNVVMEGFCREELLRQEEVAWDDLWSADSTHRVTEYGAYCVSLWQTRQCGRVYKERITKRSRSPSL